MTGTQKPDNVSTKYQRIAALARMHPDRAFVSLAHHIDLDWLYAAWRRTRKSGAVGVDGQNAAAFAEHLDERLRALLELTLPSNSVSHNRGHRLACLA